MNDRESFLYKYRAIDDEHIDRSSRIFTHNEIYFASADQFNDPFDCKAYYSFKASKEDQKKYLLKNLTRNYPNWNRQQVRSWISKRLPILSGEDSEFRKNLSKGIEHTLSGIGICSLSSVPDDILMWSHYANSHQGFCLKFFDDPKDRFVAVAQEVLYSEGYPIVNPVKDADIVRLQKTLLTKSRHWEYEKEWRIIDHEEGPGVKHFPQHLLVGVIFGCRTTGEHERLIMEWCKSRKAEISFYKARQASKTYSLELVEV